jgi:drug/metabolite transporter (DMT)-like permease
MSRQSWILFLVPVLVWSTTFYAITFQLGSVTAPAYAVAMRFGCAAALLFIWLSLRGQPMLFSARIHLWIAASGICSYGMSYVLTYVAEQTIPSGLVAITFTLTVFLTPALARLAYGTPITKNTWLGGSLGIVGVALCFLPDMLSAQLSSAFFWGMLAMLLAAFVSSVAAVCSIYLNRIGVPVAAYTAWAMAYGAISAVIYGMLSGQALRFDMRASFWVAFAYLTVAGSVITFLSYLTLLKREGSARASYISVLAPIGAIIISVMWEGLTLQAPTLIGFFTALCGAWFTLFKKKT